jgi:hypothetical protein
MIDGESWRMEKLIVIMLFIQLLLNGQKIQKIK